MDASRGTLHTDAHLLSAERTLALQLFIFSLTLSSFLVQQQEEKERIETKATHLLTRLACDSCLFKRSLFFPEAALRQHLIQLKPCCCCCCCWKKGKTQPAESENPWQTVHLQQQTATRPSRSFLFASFSLPPFYFSQCSLLFLSSCYSTHKFAVIFHTLSRASSISAQGL